MSIKVQTRTSSLVTACNVAAPSVQRVNSSRMMYQISQDLAASSGRLVVIVIAISSLAMMRAYTFFLHWCVVVVKIR